MDSKEKKEKQSSKNPNGKEDNWYSIGVIGDKYDGTGKDSFKIIEKAKELDIDTYRSQAQGSVFYYIFCSQSEADKLISVLGKEEYACGILDEAGVELLQLIHPQIVHKSKKHRDENQKPNQKKGKKSLSDQLQDAITEYNDIYTTLNDHGIRLFNQRERSVDLLDHVERLINSIANRPKEFDSAIAQIQVQRKHFRDSCDFARQELKEAKKSAIGASAGVAGGMAVASLAPSAAMWIATTFGTASTGTAISTLSGAVATKAALAWLGGGALAAGGGGVAAGNALLALAGPIGWGIAGASLLTSIILFRSKKMKLDKEKKDEIKSIKSNTEQIRETNAKIDSVLKKTVRLRKELNEQYDAGLIYYNMNYLAIPEGGQLFLGAIVNNATALATSLSKEV